MPDYSNVKMGKKDALLKKNHLRLARYLDLSTIPEPPATVDHTRGITEWGMMLNGPNDYTDPDLTPTAVENIREGVGLCAWAGIAHGFQVSVLSQIEDPAPKGIIHPGDGYVLGRYRESTGYDPDKPETDQGDVLSSVLDQITKKDFEGRKVLGHAYVNIMDLHVVQIAIWLFKGGYCGFQMPQAWQGADLWDMVRGNKGSPGSWGGHCIFVPKSTPDGKEGITWGANQAFTNAGFTGYGDEMWVVIFDDAVPPKGFDKDMLVADANKLATA